MFRQLGVIPAGLNEDLIHKALLTTPLCADVFDIGCQYLPGPRLVDCRLQVWLCSGGRRTHVVQVIVKAQTAVVDPDASGELTAQRVRSSTAVSFSTVRVCDIF